MSRSVNVCFASCSSGNSKCGAGLPMSGEGTLRGSSVSPTASSATSATKMAKGRMKRFTIAFRKRVTIARPARGVRILALRRQPVAAVACGKRAAQRHQQAPAPDPVDEGLVLHRTIQAVALTESPSETYRSRVNPGSIAASVIGMFCTV